ncbi:MAG TPA: carboxypeptidase-like regulatory domain-containing protein [Bryobacteraceae bacterium]|nr:carboxypeptidase-like regulatory domain-containing protein [Bryobacteraceae bacterium]
MRLVYLFFWVAAVSLAQTGTGNIQGTVKDVADAVVPNATVKVLHTATNRQYQSLTNEVGFYLLPSLQTGAYQITVESPGMESWKGSLTLVTGQSAQVDPVLKPGATATSVTVAGDVTPLVTTNSATISTVLERERIEQLRSTAASLPRCFT